MIYKGFVSRDKIMLSKAYTTYVRPLLEYCTPIWSPTYVTDIVNPLDARRRYTDFAQTSIRAGLRYTVRTACYRTRRQTV